LFFFVLSAQQTCWLAIALWFDVRLGADEVEQQGHVESRQRRDGHESHRADLVGQLPGLITATGGQKRARRSHTNTHAEGSVHLREGDDVFAAGVARRVAQGLVRQIAQKIELGTHEDHAGLVR
jgi:hypothetical protein